MRFFSNLFNENQSDLNGNQVNWIPLQTLAQLEAIDEN